MKTRGWIDFFLPQKVAYHLKILIASILIAIFFNLIWFGEPVNDQFWFMIGSLVIQLEIFMYLAFRIFAPGTIKIGKTYKREIIIRLIKFYLLVLVIAIFFVFMTITAQKFTSGQSYSVIMQQFFGSGLTNFLTSWLIGIAIGSLVFFYAEWNNALKREQKLREEKLIFQYETLKSQVNPHFLFNSLNSLSSLVAKDANLSEQFIAKFSTIYRYILENRDQEFVPLQTELAFVEDYFFLQKIRDDGKIALELDIEKAASIEILPISVQLLVENALKHNAATKENPLVIRVSFEDGYLVVSNSKAPKTLLSPSSKIGLKNLQERVKLVMNREVLIEENSEKFVVKVPIKQS